MVCQTREQVAEGLEALGFQILGAPLLGLIAFRHPEQDNFAIYGEMYRKGWFTSITTQPPSLHLMLSPKHAEVVDDYLDDLKASLATVSAGNLGDEITPRYN